MKKVKPIIYQMLPRLFGNVNPNCVANGTIQQNGSGKFDDINPQVLKSLRSMGITHVWFTGVIEHSQATDYSAYGIRCDNPHVVKGLAGSPYAIKDYYDVDPDLAVNVENRMAEFEALVSRSHDANLKVIIDFVPNHVSRQYYSDARPVGVRDFGEDDDSTVAFSPNNNFYYFPGCRFTPPIPAYSGEEPYIESPAKASGNDCFTPSPSVNDWYETVKLNYGRDYRDGSSHFDPIPSTWHKMLHILLFWSGKGVDGFRCDMAHMVPIEFWEWVIPQVKRTYPSIVFIAEIYDVALYREFIFRAHFDYLYDKVNLYDTLRAIQCHGAPASLITRCWQTVDGIAPSILNFLENHDEQRFASCQYAGNATLVVPSLVVATLISTGPMMIYMGQEFGEQAADAEGFSGFDGRTTIFDYWSLPTLRRWLTSKRPDLRRMSAYQQSLRAIYAKVLTLANRETAFREGAFFDLMYVNLFNPSLNPATVFSFIRAAHGEAIFVAVNFGVSKVDVAINIPTHAFECLSLPVGDFDADELLSGFSRRLTLSPDSPLVTSIDAHGAVLLKVKYDTTEKSVKK